ncbi:MAG: hypothetical protein N2036_05985 [Bryobacteraceae bacterium]|nr:hypothetical protein [Bryobacteraceae bacterium]
MRCWQSALAILVRQWKDWIIVASLMTGAGAVAVLWLAAPLATATHIAMNVAYVIWGLAFLWYALWLARRRFAPEGVRPAAVLKRKEFWGALALAAAAGLMLPWGLVHWVPGFSALEAQAASALVRFLVAWGLFSGSLCWLVACLGLLSREA